MTDTSESDLAEALRRAFVRLAAADLPAQDKARWHQRLVAITNTAKRDTGRTAAKLARFDADWTAAVDDAPVEESG